VRIRGKFTRQTLDWIFEVLPLKLKLRTTELTAQQNLLEGSPDGRTVPPSIPELILTFPGAHLDTFRDLFQQRWFLATDVSELPLQPPRFLADEHRIHHQLTSYGPVDANAISNENARFSVVSRLGHLGDSARTRRLLSPVQRLRLVIAEYDRQWSKRVVKTSEKRLNAGTGPSLWDLIDSA